MDKPFWQSKTLWVNLLSLLAVVVDQLMATNMLGAKAMGVLTVANLVLRAITTGGVTATKA